MEDDQIIEGCRIIREVLDEVVQKIPIWSYKNPVSSLRFCAHLSIGDFDKKSDMIAINWWAVLAAGFSAFILGGIWYSPKLFGNAWMQDNGLTEEKLKQGNASKIFGWALVLSLVAAVNLGMFWPIHLPNVQVYVLTRPM